VTQLAAIPSHGMMVVLADKVLKAYPISYFDPNASRKVNVFKVISNHSVFFSTGTCNDKTFIITMKKKGIDSHFKAHEVICGDLTDPRNSKYLAAKTSFMSKAPSWFKLYQVSCQILIKGNIMDSYIYIYIYFTRRFTLVQTVIPFIS
jgi:hypothetical protein